MPLTVENSGAALISRPNNLGGVMKTMRVKILRKFFYERTVQEIGATPELPAVFALEMIAANKAERVIVAEPSAAPALKEEGKGKDGKYAGK